MKPFLSIAAALALSFLAEGCVSLGMSQQKSETTYTIAANLTAAVISTYSTERAGQACEADNLEYGTVISTRNVADGVDYGPADTAHKLVLHNGAKLNPAACGS